MMRTKSVAWQALGAALMALAFTLPSRAQDVRLGLIDMYGGNFAAQANAIRVGMQIALDQANTANLVKGRKLSLTAADMGISVEKAVTEARRMILDDKLHYVIVGSHSGAAVALADLIKNQD